MKKTIFTRCIGAVCALILILSGLICPAGAEDSLPEVVITEVCFNTTYKENEYDVSKSADMLEFIEIKNMSGQTLDLHGWKVTYRNGDWDAAIGGENQVVQVLASGGYELKNEEIAIFAVYTQDAVKVGMKYDTAEDFAAVYEQFTAINGGKSYVPIENFYLIPKAYSGKLENIPGTFNLPNEKESTVLTFVNADGETVCECKYSPIKFNRNNYSLNLMYTGGVEGHPRASEPFNMASPTPGRLFENQIPALTPGLTPAADVKTLPLTLMEYNICATDSTQTHANGTAVTMDERADGVFSTIFANDPDVLCLCEVNFMWRPYLNKAIDGENGAYASYGMSSQGKEWTRANIGTSVWDLYNLICWKKDKYDLAESGTFWCSKTPTKRNTFNWEDGTVGDFARAINWVILEEKQTGARFFVLCQHIDAKSARARELSATLIAQYATDLSQGLPVMMTGDWNCGDASSAYKALMASGKFADARYRTASPEAMTLYGSFNSWGGNTTMTAMSPIDHCILSKDTVYVNYAKTDYGCFNTDELLYASDHNATVYGLELVIMSNRTEETAETDTEPAEPVTLPDTDTASEIGTDTVTEPATAAADTEAVTDSQPGGCSSVCLSCLALLPLLCAAALATRRKQ